MESVEPQVMESLKGRDSLIVPLIAGGVAGLFTDVALFPLDTIKTRLQQGGLCSSGSIMRGLYSGIGPAALAAAPSAAIFFTTYELMKQNLGNDGGFLKQGSAAAVAEIAACVFKVPFEVIKQRQQAGGCTNSRLLLARIYRNQGIRGCYSGFLATVFREIPFGFIQMPVYEFLKKEIQEMKRGEISGMEACLCGATAGGIAAAITCPIDVWKTRLMLGSRGVTILSIWREEGFSAIFSGIVPRVTWIAVGGSIFFTAYELVGRSIRSL
jgi:solute carrier family 25 S-adenosylmethionine transporter 26